MSTDNCRLALNVHRSARGSAPTVHIFLQRLVRQANGMLGLTPLCSSHEEIEEEIEALQGDLETILRQARETYALSRPSMVRP
jgi:hypothetical protein